VRAHRARAGFTLIEVVVALAIVVIGMSAVLGALNSSAETLSYLRDKTFAQWVGLNQVANLRLSGQQTPTGNSTGEVDFAGRSWHWRQEVTATQIPGVVRIDVKVRPADVKAGDDDGWFTTVSGMQGDAVAVPNGYLPDWGSQVLPGQATQQAGLTGTGQPGTIGSAPGTSVTTGSSSTLAGPGTLGGSSSPGGSTLGGGDTLGGPDTLGGSQGAQSPGSQPLVVPPPSDQGGTPESQP
jgi:general secretion pathway protein I